MVLCKKDEISALKKYRFFFFAVYSIHPTCFPMYFFGGENISFDASLVIYIYIYIYIYSTNNPAIIIINRIYETQNLLSL